MITVRLAGGLGNQMFQFAAGLALARQHSTQLQLDAADLVHDTGCTPRDYGLGVFRLVDHVRRDRTIGASSKLLDFLSAKIGALKKERSSRFDPSFHHYPSSTILEGYWQSPRYFERFASDVREAFTWKDPLNAASIALVERIHQHTTASIHFRRGDYVSNPNAAKIHGGICSGAYYSLAMSRLRQDIPRIRFVVFSDEPDWVKANYPELGNEIFAMGNVGHDAHLDMRIMSLCDHHIIANSTFSWWGAWLGRNVERRVIAPRQWFSDRSDIEILPDHWEAI